MRREELVDLNAFATVAEEQSFTRAAAKLGTSQSALSHTLNRLEARVGVRLLTRTTRKVAPTEAGERLLNSLGPALDEIAAAIASVAELRDRPAGNIRITTSEHAAQTVLWPALERLLPLYPDIRVELNCDGAFADIVEQRYDAGVRLGEAVAKDMIAVRIGLDMRMAVVGSPAYFARRGKPKTPRDLADHVCINMRMPSSGGFYAWEFQKGRTELNVRVEGQIAVNNVPLALAAASAGLGLAFVLEDRPADQFADGRLVRVLEDWCQPFPGYHLYYPSRRQPSAAFALLVEALRYRDGHPDRRRAK